LTDPSGNQIAKGTLDLKKENRVRTQRVAGTLGLVLALVFTASLAGATVTFDTMDFPGVDGVTLRADASFTISGDTLTIVWRNIAPPNPGIDVPGNQLTGLFFDLPGTPTLTPVSATITSGMIIQAATCSPGPCDGVTNVGGEFFYDNTLFGAESITSDGYLGGAAAVTTPPYFSGANLDDPNAPNGINFALVSINESSFAPNGGLSTEPLIQGEVTLVLHGLSGFSEGQISNVRFQYGTDLGAPCAPQPCFPSVPAPPVVVLMGTGLVGLVGLTRLIPMKR
jgi:hypothetical protein